MAKHHSSDLWRKVSFAIAVLAALSTIWFGLRSYGSYGLLRSAYAAGSPGTSTLRAWMTLRYIASTYRVPEAALLGQVPAGTSFDTTIKVLAEREGVPPWQYVQRMQRIIAQSGSPAAQPESRGWLTWLNDEILSGLLTHGYVVLAITLLLGAIGFPLPTGFSVAIAGSLVATGDMSLFVAVPLAVAASAFGDMVAYTLGRSMSDHVLLRFGRWFGYSPARHARAKVLFERFGGWTVLITRTLVSHLSSMVSLLAGISRYEIGFFAGFAVAGRLLWTGTYLGLGYAVGGSFDAATEFLKNLSGLLLSVSMLAAAMLVFSGRVRPLSR